MANNRIASHSGYLRPLLTSQTSTPNSPRVSFESTASHRLPLLRKKTVSQPSTCPGMFLNETYIEPHMEDYSTNCNHVSTPDFIKPLEWDWDYELADRKNERTMDTALHGCIPFHVDRKVLKDVVREKMGIEVGKITFLSSGTFHKAYLVTLVDRFELVARVARRFMPRLKTGSEVATMAYLREYTNTPVPVVYHYDSNPYNRLGGEYILMSKASGIPLAKVFHSLSYNELVKLCTNLASLIIPLFSHRFPQIGSLYFGQTPRVDDASSVTTPKPIEYPYRPLSLEQPQRLPYETKFHVGPIVSWPFFGSNRGELLHPTEINRGPWSSTKQYLASCAEREATGVIRENEGRSAPHKLHLDPDEIRSSWHHQMKAVPGDESDDSDEWDLEESDEDDWDAGDVMYRDYRRMQRTTFLVAHLAQREAKVREEMARWTGLMGRLSKMIKEDCPEEFGLDLHDLNLENVFVDSRDPTKITGIIDFESTTTRPLWACAHLPAFLLSTPFTTRLFRQAVQKMAEMPPKPGCKEIDLATLAKEWLYYEEHGVRLRLAHRFVEWDGWEEGLIDSMLGPEEMEDEWFQDWNESTSDGAGGVSPPLGTANPTRGNGPILPGLTSAVNEVLVSVVPVGGANRRALPAQSTTKAFPYVKEKDKEKMLNTTGDICGGRGGELGRRLEAWLTVGPPSAKRWAVVDGVDGDHE